MTSINPEFPSAAHNPVSFRTSLLHKIADRNPFYLISAACMLGGCLAVTNSLSWTSLPLQRLLILIATLNLYEGALIGLSILLLKRGLLRDGNILLIVEAFFLVDLTFLNAEIVTASLRVGLLVNTVLLVLTAVKLRLVMRALGDLISTATFVFVLIQMLALLAIPCVLRDIDHGSVSPMDFYITWWIVGLMPVVREITIRIWPAEKDLPISGPARVYIAMPWISLLTHLGILHYVYNVDFYGAMATPVLLGLTIVLNRAVPSSFFRRTDLLALRVLLPAGAILVSLNNPHLLAISVGHHLINTSLIAIAGTYLTYIYIFLLPVAAIFLAIGAVAGLLAIFGPSFDDIQRFAWRIWTWIVEITNWIVPSTVVGWGIVSVLASFFFLGLGAAVSFARPKVVTVESPSADLV